MFSNVVWATDGSEHADNALEFAAELAAREGGTLHAIHVVEKLAGPRVGGENARMDEPRVTKKVNEQLAEVASERGIKTTVQISPTPGNTAKRIADLAHDANADLIVVGTRGHSAVVGAILGSVTQRLLHMTHCPVLAVPPRDRPGDAGANADKLTAVGR